MLEVYGFERKDGSTFTDWTTQNPAEAKEYAQQYGLRVVAYMYEFSDSEMVWDFTHLEGEN